MQEQKTTNHELKFFAIIKRAKNGNHFQRRNKKNYPENRISSKQIIEFRLKKFC